MKPNAIGGRSRFCASSSVMTRSDALLRWIFASLTKGSREIQVHCGKEQKQETPIMVFTREHMDLRTGKLDENNSRSI
ncbi:hypothetical protein L1987_25170 [Smallanthus sonchifolius]|uniref:Uncharacterized protein n=1 Tax=Smallanthus sonchifolius TaxID=185202 RepID=A0ACB9INX1_9ASTR|nr:hypothetical protein L1987_25170 [Smallanthus sonchifolius]